MLRRVLTCFRLAAAALLFAAVITWTDSQPLYAGGGGGCLAADDYLCLTGDPEAEPYENKYCGSGGGESCITCRPEPEAICNAFEKDSDEGWYNGAN